MKNKEYTLNHTKLILCDIDGTLYDWSRKLTPKTVEVINQLHQQGYEIGLASGRPYEELCQYPTVWGFDFDFDVIIGLNGAEIWDIHHDEVKEFYKLSCDTLKEIFDIMNQFEANPFLYWHHKILCIKIDDMMKKSARTSNREIVVADSYLKLCEEENAKIMFRMTEDEMKKVEAYFENHSSTKFAGFKTQSTLFEFMDPRISKGFAVNELCKMNDYTEENILAFGDTTNDNSMLEKAGWGVCLLNGSDDTKAIADEITTETCANDGFANYIEKYLLKRSCNEKQF